MSLKNNGEVGETSSQWKSTGICVTFNDLRLNKLPILWGKRGLVHCRKNENANSIIPESIQIKSAPADSEVCKWKVCVLITQGVMSQVFVVVIYPLAIVFPKQKENIDYLVTSLCQASC